MFIEAKKLLVEVSIYKKVSIEDALESLRKQLVIALKHGRTLVIRMSDTAIHWEKKFTHPDFFPIECFKHGGRELFKEDVYKKVIRDEDKDHNVFVVHPDFKVVITSMFQVEDYEEFLKDSVPLEWVVPIRILEPVQQDPL